MNNNNFNKQQKRDRDPEDFEHEQWLIQWLLNPANIDQHRNIKAPTMCFYIKSIKGKNISNTKKSVMNLSEAQQNIVKQTNLMKDHENQIENKEDEIEEAREMLEEAMDQQMTILDQNNILIVQNRNLELDQANNQALIEQRNNQILQLNLDVQNIQAQNQNVNLLQADLCRVCVVNQMDSAITPCYCIYFCQQCAANYGYNRPCPGCTLPMTGSRVIRIR